MKMGNLPKNLAIFVCKHVFNDFTKATSISRDFEGDIAVGCGCSFDTARVVAFSFLIEAFPEIANRRELDKGEFFELNRDSKMRVRRKE